MGNILGISETAPIQLLLVSVPPVARPPELLGPIYPLHTPPPHTHPLQPRICLFSLCASCTPPLSLFQGEPHLHSPDLPSRPNFQFSCAFQDPASLPTAFPVCPGPGTVLSLPESPVILPFSWVLLSVPTDPLWGLFISGSSSPAAAAKSLQSCPALCDPIGGSPPGSLVPGILQARTLEWVVISFSNA